MEISRYPNGKDFAFTITEDPDYSKLEDRLIVYRLLSDLEFKTTVAVWVLDNEHGSGENAGLSNTRGLTTSNAEYLKHLKELQEKGFEICLHTAGPGNDLRGETVKGYELFKQLFGHYPRMNINHATNLENIYWGKDRFSNGLLKLLYGLKSQRFEGHVESSAYFWGDICREKTKYVRAWATDKINTLSINRTMPYHLEDKPYVNWWFGCSDGYNCNKFNNLISDSNIKKLISERGTCIAYTHFSKGFLNKEKNIDAYFRKQIEKISHMDGWFVPASTILDRFLLLRNVDVSRSHNTIAIINKNSETLEKVTILTNKKKLFLFNKGEWRYSNNQGEIVLGDILPHTTLVLGTASEEQPYESPKFFERVSMVVNWIFGRLSGKG